MEVDPDYAEFVEDPEEEIEEQTSRIYKESVVRKATEGKIRDIIDEQFDKEIETKENELNLINERLNEARCMMDRLRACVVASFYASSFTKPLDGARGPDPGASQHPAIQDVLRKAVTKVLSKNTPHKTLTSSPKKNEGKNENKDVITEDNNDVGMNESGIEQIENADTSVASPSTESNAPCCSKELNSLEDGKKTPLNLGGRHRIKKTVIVGNVSKYIPSDQREVKDRSTHKWMVYVRGSKDEPRIDNFIRKVWFFLHPSYRPNDLVEVCEAPYHLTRRGWGEFPIRVQIHFCDRRNRPVDIIHELKLDRTYTGLQTLGAETVCEVELDRSSVRNLDDMLDVTMPKLSPVPIENEARKSEGKSKESKSDIADTSQMENKSEEELDESDAKHAGNSQFQPVTKDCTISGDKISPPRKRKTDEGETQPMTPSTDKKRKVENSVTSSNDVENVSTSPDQEDLPSPLKKRRKRRRDGCRTSTSEDEILSDSDRNNSSMTNGECKINGIEEKEPESKSVCLSHSILSNSKNSEESDIECNDKKMKNGGINSKDLLKQNGSDDSDASLSSFADMKQPVVLLPRSQVAEDRIFRLRSASDSEGFFNKSCANLIKSGVSVTPVLNVKLNSDSGSDGHPSPTKKIQIVNGNISPKNSLATKNFTLISKQKNNGASTTNSNDIKVNTATLKQIKKEVIEQPHITIPLSSLLKSGVSLPQAHVLKLSPPSSAKSPTFSVNMLNLVAQKSSPKMRQKRSFSADHTSAKTISVTTLNSKDGSHAPIQIQIISPPGLKKGKGIAQPQPLTLQTLQNALSSGTVSFTQTSQNKPSNNLNESTHVKKQDGSQQQLVLTTIKGKQHLTLVPSTTLQGNSRKFLTIISPNSKGKKGPLTQKQAITTKMQTGKTGQAPCSGSHRPSQQEATTVRAVHKLLGDQIEICEYMTSFIEDILPRVVKLVPLVSETRDLTQFPFCAKSEADFLDWNVGKQRASEWQRASLILKILKYVQDKSENLKKCKLPSKKYIMTWCLRHGYSVFTDEYEKDDSETQDEQTHEIPSTLSSYDDLFKLLDQRKEEHEKQNLNKSPDDDDVIFVDVDSVDSPTNVPNVKRKSSDTVESVPEMQMVDVKLTNKIQTLVESPEVNAVEELTRNLGRNLQRPHGVPACHLVLARALKQFTENLLRKSHASALLRRDGKSVQRVAPDEIRIADVNDAIRETSKFDFLTDKNFASSV